VPATPACWWDLASLTKVLVTLPAVRALLDFLAERFEALDED